MNWLLMAFLVNGLGFIFGAYFGHDAFAIGHAIIAASFVIAIAIGSK